MQHEPSAHATWQQDLEPVHSWRIIFLDPITIYCEAFSLDPLPFLLHPTTKLTHHSTSWGKKSLSDELPTTKCTWCSSSSSVDRYIVGRSLLSSRTIHSSIIWCSSGSGCLGWWIKLVNLTCDVEVDTVQTMEVLDLIWLGPYFI